jgi:hypothetical protein
VVGGGSGPAGRPPAGAGLLRLDPGSWRRRYEAEVVAMLEQLRIGLPGRLDLIRGAIDARLHEPTRAPAIAALVAGGLWTFAGAGVIAQPVPPAWPGYLIEVLPLAVVATGLAIVAIIGCWARRSDGGGRAGTVVIGLAVLGHLAWLMALGSTFLGAAPGPTTMATQTLGALGSVLVGLFLIRGGDDRIGSVLVVAPVILLFGWPFAWVGFGLGWNLVGVLLLNAPDPDQSLPTRFA